MTTKYIFITGGVTSSLGKGIIAASLAKLLQARGYKVTIQKFDPYINIDPGTMNPYEHGECYVTDDGTETDLDLGHYERFLNCSLSANNNVTTGKIYHAVINKERQGKYLGKTVQVIPHITDEIKLNLYRLDKTGEYDIIITEIGGCVGDIESLPFIEAIRQVQWEVDKTNFLVIHLTLVPYLKTSQELKTKPTQHSVKALAAAGINCSILICRSEQPLPAEVRAKIASFCNVSFEHVISAVDAKNIYEVPLLMHEERLDKIVLNSLNLRQNINIDLDHWKLFLAKLKQPVDEVDVAIVGKYVELPDSYKSIIEALIHAGTVNKCKINLNFIASDQLKDINQVFSKYHGVIVAPGFGDRGIEGKIKAIQYLRESKVPFLGICLGLQCAVIEFARHVLKIEDAHSSEMKPNAKNCVIHLLEGQKRVTKKGATMRLGAYSCTLDPNSLAAQIYKTNLISERHRHRYEFNNMYLDMFEKHRFKASGKNIDLNLVEIMELTTHPFYIGTQYHPEFKSRVESPHPLFISFNQACLDYKQRSTNS